MKTLGGSLIIIGMIVLSVLAFLIHLYLGMLTTGSFCILLGSIISDNHKQ